MQDFYRTARYDGLSGYCAPCTLSVTRNTVQTLRAAALDHLGDKCATCGYCADPRALQIDHVNGGGRRSILSGERNGVMYRAVVNDTTGRFQLLCANCNAIKRNENREHGSARGNRVPPAERRPTRRYLTAEQCDTVARLVAVEGVAQTEVAARFGITQSVVSHHTRKRYPAYDGLADYHARRRRLA